ncbi:hypothetical protein ACLMJK_007307 [Lecanora helva]
MAIYGKKKKGLFPSLAVFQDEKTPDSESRKQQPAKTRLAKTFTRRRRSQSRGGLEESSGDELADTAILYNVPHESARLPSSYSLNSVVQPDITRPRSSKSTKTLGDDAINPLPPLAVKNIGKEQRQRQLQRPALAKKTTNLKKMNTNTEATTKPDISSPILQATTNASIAIPDASRPTTSHTTQSASAVQTSTADAENFSKKISSLMAQAAAQEEQTKQKTDAYAATSVKASPLARGKNAFVKARRAIKEKISNSSMDKPSKLKRPAANRHSSFHGAASMAPPMTEWQYENLCGVSREGLDRRIAEGENLSNPKIQSLMGNANIPRKPLPVYETMKSRSMRSEPEPPAEDPFSDNRQRGPFLPRNDFSGFNFDFGNQQQNDNLEQHDEDLEDTAEASVNDNDSALNVPHAITKRASIAEAKPRFSNLVSGLRQHPDVMHFASPPQDHSTPRGRLEPKARGGYDNYSGPLPKRSVSAVTPSHEYSSQDIIMQDLSPQGQQARLSDGSSLSIKRKEATEDLRAQPTPTVKKAKTIPIPSKEDAGLVTGIHGLEAGTKPAPASPQKGNNPARKASKRKGLGIFTLGKGKAPDIEEHEDQQSKSRVRPRAVTRSSFSRPSSIFHLTRSSRGSTNQSMQGDGDDMDIDELQTNDSAYHIGGKG